MQVNDKMWSMMGRENECEYVNRYPRSTMHTWHTHLVIDTWA
jgi:hypothetical protein